MLNQDKKGKMEISLPKRGSSNEIREAHHKDDALKGRSSKAGSSLPHGDEDSERVLEGQQQQDRAHYEIEASIESSRILIERSLEEWSQPAREEGRASAICICRLPHDLMGINEKAEKPELVSIGPYHHSTEHLLKFKKHKWYFLDKLLRISLISLSSCLREMRNLEEKTRACYSDIKIMPSHDFVEMMLLDACFVLSFLRHCGSSGDASYAYDPFFTNPYITPILIRDLLKLENQLPFFVLDKLFNISMSAEDKTSLKLLALKFVDTIFQQPSENLECHPLILEDWTSHLLDLFYWSLIPSSREVKLINSQKFRPSSQSIQCVTQLRPSGIKFKPRKANSFLDIKFQNRVLEIPIIAVNDFTSTLLLNCVALEQCQEQRQRCARTYFTDYIAFMKCLINQPRDVALLSLDGIITSFSRDDIYVTDLFNNLGKNVLINVDSCYLHKEFKDLDAYFNSCWANMMRTYFASPWSFISAFSAFIVIVLSFIQTIMSVLSYHNQFG